MHASLLDSGWLIFSVLSLAILVAGFVATQQQWSRRRRMMGIRKQSKLLREGRRVGNKEKKYRVKIENRA